MEREDDFRKEALDDLAWAQSKVGFGGDAHALVQAMATRRGLHGVECMLEDILNVMADAVIPDEE